MNLDLLLVGLWWVIWSKGGVNSIRTEPIADLYLLIKAIKEKFNIYPRGDSMKKIENFEKFSNKKFWTGLFSLSFLSQSRSSRLYYTTFRMTMDQCKILNFSTRIWSAWTKNLWAVRKNGPPRAAGRGLCKMGAGRPQVFLSAVKSLASSGAFEKFTKN